jgi:mRNA turnover protein 4
MPRSKRAKVVSLTKATPKKAKEFRQGKVELLRDAVEEYENVFVFSFTNMRESKLKEVRMDWKESRIYLGKNRVAQVALGRTEEEEIRDNIRFVSERLTGDVGLIFTNREKDDVVKYFGSFSHPDYAKAGMVPQKDVLLKPGKLSFPVGMLDQLRKLGMVVEVDDTKQCQFNEHYNGNTNEVLSNLRHLSGNIETHPQYCIPVNMFAPAGKRKYWVKASTPALG